LQVTHRVIKRQFWIKKEGITRGEGKTGGWTCGTTNHNKIDAIEGSYRKRKKRQRRPKKDKPQGREETRRKTQEKKRRTQDDITKTKGNREVGGTGLSMGKRKRGVYYWRKIGDPLS